MLLRLQNIVINNNIDNKGYSFFLWQIRPDHHKHIHRTTGYLASFLSPDATLPDQLTLTASVRCEVWKFTTAHFTNTFCAPDSPSHLRCRILQLCCYACFSGVTYENLSFSFICSLGVFGLCRFLLIRC